MAEFFGFTNTESTIWNAVGYGAFVAIILGVLFEKPRKSLLFFGPLALFFYAWLFLHNPLLTVLQILISISGFCQLVSAPQRFSRPLIMVATVGAAIYLGGSGHLAGLMVIIGAVGFLCVAFGIAGLPKPQWFLVMAVGGVLLVIYALSINSWVYVFLNGFFAIANLFSWVKATPSNEQQEARQ